ncbi:hypothetical protein HMPREF6123_1189 [Oribacterium sinus F0268]|uniref:Uncharacterized protein n=1 Tax=Oribacterium sinus F0268 TaxID=585501 RepID=C2KXH0_9FIRM|nr:hypothetical protein HMPREF6123_1189 [Oribacterium sinus F0268]
MNKNRYMLHILSAFFFPLFLWSSRMNPGFFLLLFSLSKVSLSVYFFTLEKFLTLIILAKNFPNKKLF